jgi:hypothetical protein
MRFKVKETKKGFYPMVRRNWYSGWEHLYRTWGRLRNGILTDCRIVTCIWGNPWQNIEQAQEIINMAKAQPTVKNILDYCVAGDFNDEFEHFDIKTHKLVSI